MATKSKSAVRRGTSYAGKIDQQERGTSCGLRWQQPSKQQERKIRRIWELVAAGAFAFVFRVVLFIPPDRALLREIKRGLLQFPRFAYAVVRRAPLRMLHVACALGRFRGGTESVYYS
jgi:hypothetical protein